MNETTLTDDAARLLIIPQEGRLFVYGAGSAGRAMARALGNLDRPARAFLDSARSDPAQSPPVVSLSDYLADRRDDDVILICSSFAEEIMRNLERHALPAFDFSHLAALLASEESRLDAAARDGILRLDRPCPPATAEALMTQAIL